MNYAASGLPCHWMAQEVYFYAIRNIWQVIAV